MFSFMRPCGAAAAGGVTTYRIFFIIYQKNNYKCGAFGHTFIIIFLINYEKYSLGWHSCSRANDMRFQASVLQLQNVSDSKTVIATFAGVSTQRIFFVIYQENNYKFAAKDRTNNMKYWISKIQKKMLARSVFVCMCNCACVCVCVVVCERDRMCVYERGRVCNICVRVRDV